MNILDDLHIIHFLHSVPAVCFHTGTGTQHSIPVPVLMDRPNPSPSPLPLGLNFLLLLCFHAWCNTNFVFLTATDSSSQLMGLPPAVYCHAMMQAIPVGEYYSEWLSSTVFKLATLIDPHLEDDEDNQTL